MAYINIHEWKCEQVTEWLKGIEVVVNNSQYLSAFSNNFFNGTKLLSLRPYELIEIGITKIGHQEIILEAVENLKNFHYNLDKENLQYLGLLVNTASTNLNRKLLKNEEHKLNTEILSDVAVTTSRVKVLISWLDRSPFKGQTQYSEVRTQMLRLSLELATIAQRDRFVQNPIQQITNLTQKLSKLANYIIQDISDPIIIQPCFLDLVTLKKKESELGFYIMPSYQYIHRVTNVKFNSPAHNSGKVEEGDEIVQINYQTVIGWHYKKVWLQLQDLSSTDVILTLKKRPKHTSLYGQLTMGLIKLPSKKRTLPYRFDNLPSPRVELINIPDLMLPPPLKSDNKMNDVIEESDESSGNESDLLTPTSLENKNTDHLFLPKMRPVLQRRHTICGDDLVNFKHIESYLWYERKSYKKDLDAPSMRDKSISVSIGFGLEMTQRPTTCIGSIGGDKLNEKRVDKIFQKRKKELPDKQKDAIQEHESENIEEEEIIKSGVSKVVQLNSNKSIEIAHDSKYMCNVQNTILESLLPIPYVDADDDLPVDERNMNLSKNQEEKKVPLFDENVNTDLIEAVNETVIKREIIKRARLEKSQENFESNNSLPPSVEPRQQMRPIPPIPPRKQVSNPPVESNNNIEEISSEKPLTIDQTHTMTKKKAISDSSSHEISELVTNKTKTKTLTSKKSKTLHAKRRKVNLKLLETNSTIQYANIQGHLYRRAQDKSEVAYWVKLYFVLIDTALYGFKSKDASKADCVIYLSGFTVSTAKEVHSKANSFKVYHPKKTFYLAAETETAMMQWISYIREATMKGPTNTECDAKELYSETECSDDEDVLTTPQSPQRNQMLLNTSTSPLALDKSSVSDISSPPSLSTSTTSSSSKHLYHINFGSIKKTFGRSSNSNDSTSNISNDNKFLGGIFSSSKTEKKSNNDIIVPTAQFKTYRKVKENNGGLQLGATSMINSNISDLYLSSSLTPTTSINTESLSLKAPPVEIESEPPKKVLNEEKPKPSPLRKPHNFLHASNPNLLDFNNPHQLSSDFPTSSSSNNTWDHQITGQITLLDLMLQQRAEEMKDMYTKRVDQGFEKIEDKNTKTLEKKPIALPHKSADPHIEKIQKRSLPITPDDVLSFKPDDRAIVYARSKEGLKLRDFGYELISNDDDSNQNNNNGMRVTPATSHVNALTSDSKSNQDGGKLWSSTKSKTKRKIAPLSGSVKKKSGFSWISSNEDASAVSCLGNSSGSFRKAKKSESSENESIQSPPSTSKIAYFSKLSFSNTKEKKKLLGSPKLHRAIFGKNISQQTSTEDEIATPSPPPPVIPKIQPSEMKSSTSSELSYQHLQLPPTFKAETYSLNFLKSSKNEQ